MSTKSFQILKQIMMVHHIESFFLIQGKESNVQFVSLCNCNHVSYEKKIIKNVMFRDTKLLIFMDNVCHIFFLSLLVFFFDNV